MSTPFPSDGLSDLGANWRLHLPPVQNSEVNGGKGINSFLFTERTGGLKNFILLANFES
ncbi:hypothetical protein [Pseudoruegeria sp. HB172150]|uniref:hypothetical protein n=1 Tax=Pseudoruegeria sp. HB172150 TaxID=2721164 RepID=UPI001C130BA4|nr:hypothetical protein [Pseudoruegeria sp. HB172150]